MKYKRIETDTKRDVLVEYKDGVGFYINRKSRFIVRDTEKLLQKIEKYNDIIANRKVYLIITAPVCSKSKKILQENNIEIIEENLK